MILFIKQGINSERETKRRIGEPKRIDAMKRRIGEPKWMATNRRIGDEETHAGAILSQTVIVKNRL